MKTIFGSTAQPVQPSDLTAGREIARHLGRAVWVRLNSEGRSIHRDRTNRPDEMIHLDAQGGVIERRPATKEDGRR